MDKKRRVSSQQPWDLGHSWGRLILQEFSGLCGASKHRGADFRLASWKSLQVCKQSNVLPLKVESRNKQRSEQSCFACEPALVYGSLEPRTLRPPTSMCYFVFLVAVRFCLLTRPVAAWDLINYFQEQGHVLNPLNVYMTSRPLLRLWSFLEEVLGQQERLLEPQVSQGSLLKPPGVCFQSDCLASSPGNSEDPGLEDWLVISGDVKVDNELHEDISYGFGLSLYPQNHHAAWYLVEAQWIFIGWINKQMNEWMILQKILEDPASPSRSLCRRKVSVLPWRCDCPWTISRCSPPLNSGPLRGCVCSLVSQVSDSIVMERQSLHTCQVLAWSPSSSPLAPPHFNEFWSSLRFFIFTMPRLGRSVESAHQITCNLSFPIGCSPLSSG